jgi:chorismate lyase/3-hydroxybenzoate synthase
MTVSQAKTDLLQPPGWLSELAGTRRFIPDTCSDCEQSSHAGPTIKIVRNPPFVFVGAHFPCVTDLSSSELEKAAADIYQQFRTVTVAAGAPHPLRFWNFIPRINEEMHTGLDRYMAFNAGRRNALSQWFSVRDFSRSVPTATGVGYTGHCLCIYCLAGQEPGVPVENSRQRAAYLYSRRYGPAPPCFARGMLIHVNGSMELLVGGTASVRGEDSVHVGCIKSQLDEILDNLKSLAESAIRLSGMPKAIARFFDLRAYFVHAEDQDLIRSTLMARFRDLERLELVKAELCRRELLVEVEGIASICER